MGKRAAIMAKLKMPAPMMGMIQCTDARADQPYQLQDLFKLYVTHQVSKGLQESDRHKQRAENEGRNSVLGLTDVIVFPGVL